MRYPEEDWRHFVCWATLVRRSTDVPTSMETLLLFVEDLVSAGKSYQTIRKRCNGVAAYNVLKGSPDLRADVRFSARLAELRQSVFAAKRTQKAALLRSGLRNAIRSLKDHPRGLATARNVSILTLARAVAAKPGSLVSLNLCDIRIHEECFEVNLSRGNRKEWTRIVRDEQPELCPVAAIHQYLGTNDGTFTESFHDVPLYRTADANGRLRGARLKYQDVSDILRQALRFAGIEPGAFSAQSIRVGRLAETVASNEHRVEDVANELGYASRPSHLREIISSARNIGPKLANMTALSRAADTTALVRRNRRSAPRSRR